MPKTVAVYAGSFDPITKGHEWMISEGSKLFDTLNVLAGIMFGSRTSNGRK